MPWESSSWNCRLKAHFKNSINELYPWHKKVAHLGIFWLKNNNKSTTTTTTTSDPRRPKFLWRCHVRTGSRSHVTHWSPAQGAYFPPKVQQSFVRGESFVLCFSKIIERNFTLFTFPKAYVKKLAKATFLGNWIRERKSRLSALRASIRVTLRRCDAVRSMWQKLLKSIDSAGRFS